MEVVSFRDVRTIFGNSRNYPSFQIMARRASRYVFDVSAFQLHHGVLADRRVPVERETEEVGPVRHLPVRLLTRT